MNPSSKPQPKTNKTAAAKTETAPKTTKKAAPASEAKAKPGKKIKTAKSAHSPEATRAAKTPGPKKIQATDKKPKLVHDSYSLPKDEDAALGALKRRAVALGLKVKKNSLLRAGLLTLGKLGDTALLEALRALPEPAGTVTTSDAAKPAKTKATKAGKAPKKPGKANKPAVPVASTDATQAP